MAHLVCGTYLVLAWAGCLGIVLAGTDRIMAKRTPATHFFGRTLLLACTVVGIAALLRSIMQRPSHAAPSHLPSLGTAVPSPNLARDPFTNRQPKPESIVRARPSVKGEAAIAVLAIGAYVAVFAMSLFGGDTAPDLLNVRAGDDSSPARAEVLSAQTTSTAFAEPATVAAPESNAPAPPPAEALPPQEDLVTVEPAPAEPTAPAEPEPPAQHVLRSGETLTSVAALYGVTVFDLAAANALTSDRVLAGQVLIIPR